MSFETRYTLTGTTEGTRRVFRATAILAGVVLSVLFSSQAVFAQYGPPVGDNDYDDSNQNIFLTDEVATMHITMDPADLDFIINNTYSDEYKVCSMHFTNSRIDETLDDVGIRARGNVARQDKKFPWKLNFNYFVPGRKFHGLERFNVNANATDPTMSRPRILFDLFREMGVPAPRTHYIHMTINDGLKVEGVYLQTEQVDEEFVQAWFGRKDGSLYKCRLGDFVPANLEFVPPGTPMTYRLYDDGEVYQEKITDDFTALAEFIDFVNNTDDATFKAGITDRLNVDEFLRAMAVDLVSGQWDGYWIISNNYYIYQNLTTGRFEYIPWDLDQSYGMDYYFGPYMFGTNWATRGYDGWGDYGFGSGSGVVPPLMERILDIPEYDNQLLSYVHEAAKSTFGIAVLDDKLDQIKALLAPLAFMGSFSGNTMDYNYTNQSFLNAFDFPGSYSAFNIPATWGLKPFIRTREAHIRRTYPVPLLPPLLFVNEVVADNETIIQDEAGEYEDYVEIYNDENVPVNVGGLYLSDYAGECRQWRIPDGTVIPAKGFLLLWCDEEPFDGPLHTNFKLSRDGEGVWLFASDANYNVVIDYLFFPALQDDESYGRFPDGSEIWGQLIPASPESSNVEPGSPFTLTVDGYCPGDVTIFASGAEPGNGVAFIVANGPGSATIPYGPWAGTQLGLNNSASLVAMPIADANGTAVVAGLVPENLCDTIYMQALDLWNGEVSQVVNF